MTLPPEIESLSQLLRAIGILLLLLGGCGSFLRLILGSLVGSKAIFSIAIVFGLTAMATAEIADNGRVDPSVFLDSWIVWLASIGFAAAGLTALVGLPSGHTVMDEALDEPAPVRPPRLQQLIDRHDAVKDSYLRHTCDDLDLVLDLPALQDTSQPFLAEFLDAYDRANAARPDHPGASTQTSSYAAAVLKLERTWQAAVQKAKIIGDSSTPAERRRILATARQHWDAINDPSTTDAERRLHAVRLQKRLNDLLIIIGKKPQAIIASARRGELPSREGNRTFHQERP